MKYGGFYIKRGDVMATKKKNKNNVKKKAKGTWWKRQKPMDKFILFWFFFALMQIHLGLLLNFAFTLVQWLLWHGAIMLIESLIIGIFWIVVNEESD